MKKYFIYILYVVSICSLNSCGGEKSTNEKEETTEQKEESLIEVTDEQFKSMKMEINSLEEKEFENIVKASGKIDVSPKNRAKVTSFVGGYVKSINVQVGDKVTKGQAVLTLESPEFIDIQKSYLETVGQIEYLKSEYERQKILFDEKISSQKKYLQAESEYKQAKATYQSLCQKLIMLNINPSRIEQGNFIPYITVYSPISGDVTSVNVNVGMAVSSLDEILEIVNTKEMYLELAVFEKDIFNLQIGKKVKMTVPQIGSEVFEAEITQIGKSVGGTDRTINVYASLDEKAKQKLLTGIFVEAQLIADSRKALSVPFDAVTKEESNYFILVLNSQKDGLYTFRKTLIKVGERNGDWLEIIPDEGLNINTKILTKGVYDLV